MLFRKRPVVVEARQYFNDADGYALLNWINAGQHRTGRRFADWTNGVLTIPTLEGQHIASVGDWIICGAAGEFYPCKPGKFEADHEVLCGDVPRETHDHA